MGPFYFCVMKKNSGIKLWTQDDRPREKFLQFGRKALSDAELLAILINSGNKDQSALDLANSILEMADQDIDRLATLDVSDLEQIKGIGPQKAITLSAGLELGRRRKVAIPKAPYLLNESRKVYDRFHPYFMDLDHEEFMIAFTNNRNQLMFYERISIGGITSTVVDIRLILRQALMKKAIGIVLMHNHPSGNLKPSPSDIDLTRKVKNAANFFDISLIDHLIFANHHYFSFADEGIL
jgi:DNA repair protein RadC